MKKNIETILEPTIDDSIMYSNYCVSHFAEKKRAVVIYGGDSLCEECFEIEIEQEKFKRKYDTK